MKRLFTLYAVFQVKLLKTFGQVSEDFEYFSKQPEDRASPPLLADLWEVLHEMGGKRFRYFIGSS